MSAAPAVVDPVVPPVAPSPTDPPKPEPITFTPEQQAHVNSIVAKEKRDAEAKAKADIEAAQAKAAEDAKAAALKEQGEFKSLSEQQAAKIAELEAETGKLTTLTEERDAALAVIAERNEVELKDAPEFVTEALAGKSAVEQFRYIQKHRDSWKQTRPTGNRESPRPAGDAFTIEQEREASGLIKRETKAAL